MFLSSSVASEIKWPRITVIVCVGGNDVLYTIHTACVMCVVYPRDVGENLLNGVALTPVQAIPRLSVQGN